VGYKFLANDTTAVPLTVSGVSGQSADIFDVTLTSGGTKAFVVNSAGVTTLSSLASGNAAFDGTFSVGPNPYGASVGDGSFGRSTTVGAIEIGGSAAAVLIDYQASLANYLTISNLGGSFAGVQIKGNLTTTSNGTNEAFVPPLYNASGGALGGTTHSVAGAVTASGASTTITLSSASAFTTAGFGFVLDATAGTIAAVAVSITTSITFTSINGHAYAYFFTGS
jgi:hypothetical protein